MQQNLFDNDHRSEEQRIQHLESLAYKVEENHAFLRPFSPEEIAEKRESITNITMLIDEEENNLRAIVKEKRAAIQLKKNEQKSIMRAVRTQAEEVIETIYMIDDQEAGEMGYYDKNGTLVSTRKLMPSERNMKINFRASNE